MRKNDDRVLACRADRAHPRHSKAALRDGDAASLFEQLAAITDAHDRGVDRAQDRVASIHAPNPRLRRLAFADVARDARDADQRAGCVVQTFDRYGNWHTFTVLAVKHTFERRDRIAACELRREVGTRQYRFFTQ